jgi:hypothetical protein
MNRYKCKAACRLHLIFILLFRIGVILVSGLKVADTGAQLRSPWMGDEYYVGGGGVLEVKLPPPPHSSHLPSMDFSADRQCLGGGGVWRIGGRGRGDHPPQHKLEG